MNDPKPNGPQRPPYDPRTPHMPRAVMPYSDEVELEIRRQVTRHHHQLAEIAELKTDRDSYKQRAELAEAEIMLLMQKQRDLEARAEELQTVITTLQTQFDTGAEIWLKSYDTLKRVQPKTVTPAQLEKPEATNDAAG